MKQQYLKHFNKTNFNYFLQVLFFQLYVLFKKIIINLKISFNRNGAYFVFQIELVIHIA